MIEFAMFDRTATYPELNGLGIGGETVFSESIPEDATFPAVRFTLVDDPDFSSTQDDEGAAELRKSRFQFDIYAHDPLEAKQIRDALVRCWENYRGVSAGISIYRGQRINSAGGGVPDSESELSREMVEFYIFWKLSS